MSESVTCYHCQSSLPFEKGDKVGRQESCHNCMRDLRCCYMCVNYDDNAYNNCLEPMAIRVIEKDKANFCDYFKLSAGKRQYEGDKLLSAADALFKKS